MNNRTFSIYTFNDADDGLFRLTLSGVDGESVTMSLTDSQCSMLNARLVRSFYKRCSKDKLIALIDDAGNYKALEDIAQKYYLCDICDFSDINLYGVKRVLKVITESLYKYPKLRSRLCYVGTHSGYEKILLAMRGGDEDVLKRFNMQYICNRDNAMALGSLAYNVLDRLMCDHEAYIATAMCVFGFFDAVLLDKNDYEGYNYIKLTSDLKRNAISKFHPDGCHTPESVVYHELGHLLDEMCGLSADGAVEEYFNSMTPWQIKEELSEYGASSIREFIAEAFAEYCCNPTPRRVAAFVGNMLEKKYRELPN